MWHPNKTLFILLRILDNTRRGHIVEYVLENALHFKQYLTVNLGSKVFIPGETLKYCHV